MKTPVIYHIPVCPFSQRVEIILALKGQQDAVSFQTIDITKPRAPWLLEKANGETALPLLETSDGKVLRESLVIMGYIEDLLNDAPIARPDPYERALENWMISQQDAFGMAGYRYVMNRDRSKSAALRDALLQSYRWLDRFLTRHNPEGSFLFDRFGMAEAVFTPLMMRFWFLEYYEGFQLPKTPDYARVRRWCAACLQHPAAQQVTPEEIIKLYYDYAVGFGNGALPTGRTRSSFVFTPDWPDRPMPPKDKYDHIASDHELGLMG